MVGQLPARVRFRDSVRLRLGPERGFLFDQRTGRIYSLNATGALVVARIQAGDSASALLARVVEAFEVDRKIAEQDFARFVNALTDEGLVDVNG